MSYGKRMTARGDDSFQKICPSRFPFSARNAFRRDVREKREGEQIIPEEEEEEESNGEVYVCARVRARARRRHGMRKREIRLGHNLRMQIGHFENTRFSTMRLPN
jgi:hypothetical protein